jgi:CBS domain-containing protein
MSVEPAMYSKSIEDIKRELEASKKTMSLLLSELKEIEKTKQKPTEEEKEGEEEFNELGEKPIQAKGRRPQSISMQRRLEIFENPPQNLKGVLSTFLVQEIALINWFRKRPVLISDTQTVERALSRINVHDILSLPVVDNVSKDVIGLIDVLDLASAITNAMTGKQFVQAKLRNDFMKRTVSSIFVQKTTKAYVVSNRVSLFTAAQHMVNTNQERFIIVGREVEGDVSIQTKEESFFDGLLTQSDILRFLTENIMFMRKEPLFKKTLRELGLGKRVPTTVSYNEIASTAFAQMGTLEISGLAVVDNDGRLFANLSVSDLKGLTQKNCMILNNSLEHFLMRDRKRGWWVKPICIDLDDTVMQTVFQFVASKVHRMYIIDDDGKPVGEINHTDILRELIQI